MAKRGRRKRTKPTITNSNSGPGRPTENDGFPQNMLNDAKRQRMVESSETSQGTGSDEDSNHEIKVDVEMDSQEDDSKQFVSEQPSTDMFILSPKNDGALSVQIGNRTGLEENGLVYKSETFDTNYEMGDILMNGSADSIIDMPLFHEVDSLMNIKHEDHLNDNVFYLPMSYSFENSMKIEMDKSHIAEVTRTLANELASPGAVVYVSPDQNKTTMTTQVKKEISTENTEDILNANISATDLRVKTEGSNSNNVNHNQKEKLGNGHPSPQKQQNGNPEKVSSGKTKKPLKKVQNNCQARAKSTKKKSPVNRQSSQSSNGLSDSGCEDSSPLSIDSSDTVPAHALLAEDPPEIDRFVICSDHTMECVLCSFTTDSYSAFKSHIICSHPCWRITKKLSKNRLLVERSVKAGTSIFNPSEQSELRTTKSGAGSSSFHEKVDQELQKVLRKYEKNPRKRQLFERNKRLFKCTICLRLFVFEGSVVNHVTDQHGAVRPYEKIHISNDHGQKFGPIYRCSQSNCYFSCESDKELEKHILDRHTQVMYRCQLCGFTEDSAEAVRNHGLCMHQQQLACSESAL